MTQFLAGFHGIVLVFVLPTLLLGLVGHLSKFSPPFQVVVAGTPTERYRAAHRELVALLGDLSAVRADARAESALDPLSALQAGNLDMLINLEGVRPEDWVIYTAVHSRLKLGSIERLATGLERTLKVIQAWAEERDPAGDEELAEETRRWATELEALGGFTPRQLLAYYPRALDRTTDFAAGTLVLIVCFLPFVLAAPSWIREQEAHTLEVLLAAPGNTGRTVLAGKWLFVVVVTLAEMLLLLVVIQSVYGIQVKPGVLGMVLLFLPAILATALLGLAVSTLAHAQAQVGMASAFYFLAITLLTGFLLPLEESSWLIRGLSQLFPLTPVLPVFKAWTVGADPGPSLGAAVGLLTTQCLAYGVVTLGTLRLALKRI